VKGRVLVIDDEAEIRRNLTVGLMQEDYQATACPDGISAIHELNRASKEGKGYDYLVTDIFMPDIDGMKILKVIKNQFPDLPVLVITGFGDERLKYTALSEHNTNYLDKPFEIEDLVGALEELSPGATTADQPEEEAEPGVAESYSAYLTVKITDPDRSMDIFNDLYAMPNVASCEAVRGEDMDIILLAQGSSQDEIDGVFEKVRAMDDVEVASMSPVERPKLDRDVDEFIDTYRDAVKKGAQDSARKAPGTQSYFIVDVDPDELQKIFTTVFFIDEVLFCDVIENGTKLVGMVTGQGAAGRMPHIVEKLSQIDGVLRVREAKVIKLMED